MQKAEEALPEMFEEYYRLQEKLAKKALLRKKKSELDKEVVWRLS